MKKCASCKQIKNKVYFGNYSASRDGLKHSCKECFRKVVLRYKRSKDGQVTKIYGNQKAHSKARGHNPPAYTKEELRIWLFSNPLFHTLFEKWVYSGYDKNKVPSVDRIDDYKGYSIDNIKLTTWEKNNKRFKSDSINGINTKRCKGVNKYSLEGKFICTYFSLHNAERKSGVSISMILQCCKGRQNTVGGFLWEYS